MIVLYKLLNDKSLLKKGKLFKSNEKKGNTSNY